MTLWLVRLAWASLPVTAGPAAGDALDGWSTPPRTLAEVFLWSAWVAALVALLAPRPLGLTVVRVVAPSLVVLAAIVLATGSADAAAAVVGLVATVVAGVLALALPSVSLACANGVAYGDERRYPLRTPPVLWLGLLPLASLLVAAGLVSGPLLLADGRIAVGIAAVVVGFPAAALAARSLHSLSGRWAVLVPAGLVLVDPLTLPDPVLFLRERIEALQAVPRRHPVGTDVLDLRLGARGGSVEMRLDHAVEFLQTRRGLRGSSATNATEICFVTVDSPDLLLTAASRRIRVA